MTEKRKSSLKSKLDSSLLKGISSTPRNDQKTSQLGQQAEEIQVYHTVETSAQKKKKGEYSYNHYSQKENRDELKVTLAKKLSTDKIKKKKSAKITP
jgi:hypothetical protein